MTLAESILLRPAQRGLSEPSCFTSRCRAESRSDWHLTATALRRVTKQPRRWAPALLRAGQEHGRGPGALRPVFSPLRSTSSVVWAANNRTLWVSAAHRSGCSRFGDDKTSWSNARATTTDGRQCCEYFCTSNTTAHRDAQQPRLPQAEVEGELRPFFCGALPHR